MIKRVSQYFQVVSPSFLLPCLGNEVHLPDEAIGAEFPVEASEKILSCLTDLMVSRVGDNL